MGLEIHSVYGQTFNYRKHIPSSILIQRLKYQATNSVLLTFDDGPDPHNTPKVLDKLDEYEAKAIFFIVGRRVKRAPDLLNEILKRGHLIGNHTYAHDNKKEPSMIAYYRDIQKCQDRIKELTGTAPNLFRPAKGVVSLATVLLPKAMGLKHIRWSLSGDDWRCKNQDEASVMAKELAMKAQPRDIILLHDDNPYINTILDVLLKALQESGYNMNCGFKHL